MTKQKVAVIGASVVGLAVACALARQRAQVTIFDRQHTWRGYQQHHICLGELERQTVRQLSSP